MRRQDPLRWMWVEAFQTLERAERLQRHFFELGSGPRSAGPVWEPPVDLFESEEHVCILVALPGARPEGIEIRLDEDRLVVTADRPVPQQCRTAVIRRLEIPYGRFHRTILLPGGRYQMEHHELVDGCLILRLRKG
ncbi:MAG: Hsp20/alpha crystallin family protein [Candidatus Eisenbacteria bacterium]